MKDSKADSGFAYLFFMFWTYVLETHLLGAYAFRIVLSFRWTYHYIISSFIFSDIPCSAIYFDINITLWDFFEYLLHDVFDHFTFNLSILIFCVTHFNIFLTCIFKHSSKCIRKELSHPFPEIILKVSCMYFSINNFIMCVFLNI